jgi:hypothetical protein
MNESILLMPCTVTVVRKQPTKQVPIFEARLAEVESLAQEMRMT